MKITVCIYCALIASSLMGKLVSVKRESTPLSNWLNQHIQDEALSTSVDKMKRPFCNAFTGCGRKRSSVYTVKGPDKTQLTLSLYKALLLQSILRDQMKQQLHAELNNVQRHHQRDII